MSRAVENQKRLVSIKSFGAVGDGVTDDAVAFQSAIAAAGEIIVPAGNYLIGTPLQLASGITLRGIGRPTLTGSAAGKVLATGASLNNVTVQGIRFAGTSSATTPTSTVGGYAAANMGLVSIVNSSDVRVLDCEFSTFYNGLTLINCDRVWVERNRIRNWLVYGVLASLCTEFAIDRNVIVGCDQAGAANAYGVSATGDEASGAASVQKACSISHNVIADIPSWDGIMSHDVSGLRVIGNDIRNVRMGIDVGHVIAANKVRDIQIIGNRIESTTVNTWGATGAQHCGILVTGFDASNRVDSVVVSGNVLRGFFKTAGMVGAGSPSHISVVFTDYATVTGNVVRDGGDVISNAGVYFAGTCQAPVVASNVLQGEMSAGGVRFASVLADAAMVGNNTIIQTDTADIGFYVTGSTIPSLAKRTDGTNSVSPYTASTSTLTLV